jgi:rod shape-determining protein MreC
LLKPAAATGRDRAAWLVIIIGLALLLIPHRLRVSASLPFQTALLAPLRLAASANRAQRDTRAENDRLSLLAVRLAVENARLQAATPVATAAPALDLELTSAPVIGRDLTTFEHWLVISRGSLHGIRPGQPVVTPEGVCGKVVACGPHQALVQTLLAPESRISVIDLRSRVPALTRPDRSGRLVLDYAPKESDFRPGDTVVTAGIGTIFPKGLRVGEVTSTPDRPDALFKPVIVRPFADVSRIERVFVISLPAGAQPDTGAVWLENIAAPEVTIPDQSGGQ